MQQNDLRGAIQLQQIPQNTVGQRGLIYVPFYQNLNHSAEGWHFSLM